MRPQVSIYMAPGPQDALDIMTRKRSPLDLYRDDGHVQFLTPRGYKRFIGLFPPLEDELEKELHHYPQRTLSLHPRSELLVDGINAEEDSPLIKRCLDHLKDADVASYVVARSVNLGDIIDHLVRQKKTRTEPPVPQHPEYFILGFNRETEIVNEEIVGKVPLLTL